MTAFAAIIQVRNQKPDAESKTNRNPSPSLGEVEAEVPAQLRLRLRRVGGRRIRAPLEQPRDGGRGRLADVLDARAHRLAAHTLRLEDFLRFGEGLLLLSQGAFEGAHVAVDHLLDLGGRGERLISDQREQGGIRIQGARRIRSCCSKRVSGRKGSRTVPRASALRGGSRICSLCRHRWNSGFN